MAAASLREIVEQSTSPAFPQSMVFQINGFLSQWLNPLDGGLCTC